LQARDQAHSCVRDRQATGRAIEQADIESAFELSQGLTQRRRRDVERLRGACEAAVLDDLGKGLQVEVFAASHGVSFLREYEVPARRADGPNEPHQDW